jgi:hypothetical protein
MSTVFCKPRTRTAAKRALSFPFVPVRQLMVRPLALGQHVFGRQHRRTRRVALTDIGKYVSRSTSKRVR